MFSLERFFSSRIGGLKALIVNSLALEEPSTESYYNLIHTLSKQGGGQLSKCSALVQNLI